MSHSKKILVIGAGYVGLAYACFFAQKHQVTILDTDESKVKSISNGISYSNEVLIQEFIEKYNKNISSITNLDNFLDFDMAIMCLPTDYDEESNFFDTKILSNTISNLNESNFSGLIVIKSTVPVGYTEAIQNKLKSQNIIFSPEFLREGQALKDILNPSRIVVGGMKGYCDKYVNYLQSCLVSKPNFHIISTGEAEAVKLFSNSYLAMRVSFFNELDTFSLNKDLSSKNIINAVCDDNRIGNQYNNPSFGYGGYCLPKDTKQLLSNYENMPQNIIGSIVHANKTRKDFIFDQIISKNVKNIGIYRLVMKKNSDNIRESSIIDILEMLVKNNFDIFIYEPLLNEEYFKGCEVINNFKKFENKSDLIIANRYDSMLDDIKDKVYTRDIFNKE